MNFIFLKDGKAIEASETDKLSWTALCTTKTEKMQKLFIDALNATIEDGYPVATIINDNCIIDMDAFDDTDAVDTFIMYLLLNVQHLVERK